MRSLNLEFRGVDRGTDVLSFPMYGSPGEFPSSGPFLLGDIVIDPSLASERASALDVTLDEELRRLLVHGLLHLLGFDHEKSPYRRKKMREKEDELLLLLNSR